LIELPGTFIIDGHVLKLKGLIPDTMCPIGKAYFMNDESGYQSLVYNPKSDIFKYLRNVKDLTRLEKIVYGVE
jgi:hypothetical protein